MFNTYLNVDINIIIFLYLIRIDQLEKRQTQDDATINVINRYWNQLNEDIRVLLQRFDAETGDELEKKGESESTTSFLTALSTWHKEELDEKVKSQEAQMETDRTKKEQLEKEDAE